MNAESRIEMGKTVKKHYNDLYYMWNKMYDRKGEARFLKSPFFVRLIGEFDGGIELERLGEPMGTQEHLTDKDPKLIPWLRNLLKELKRLGIQHRDIHPANILRYKDTFKLIDFCWANTKKYEPGLNSHYSPNDEIAVTKLINEITNKQDRSRRI